MAAQNIKNLRINLRNVQDPYKGNYRTLSQDLKEDENKWRNAADGENNYSQSASSSNI